MVKLKIPRLPANVCEWFSNIGELCSSVYEYETSMSECAHTGVSPCVCVCEFVYATGEEYFVA